MGTKSGDEHASPRSPDTTTSLETDSDTYNTSGPTYPHSTPSTGRKPWRGMVAAVETPPGIRFSGTIKASADGAETPEEDTCRKISNDRQPGPVSPKRGARSMEAHTEKGKGLEGVERTGRVQSGAQSAAPATPSSLGQASWVEAGMRESSPGQDPTVRSSSACGRATLQRSPHAAYRRGNLRRIPMRRCRKLQPDAGDSSGELGTRPPHPGSRLASCRRRPSVAARCCRMRMPGGRIRSPAVAILAFSDATGARVMHAHTHGAVKPLLRDEGRTG
ncbi:unnamed protein product [Miscanthus lutarioriparius]|uniref:Uncharacterized protein n=1 Tax=Miscanthus lutarioriparius TaxID=422564 RepID=A0A811NNR7_9POAL|nr:unnamed protein product [Miscanthus lutarioriparius]